jgi:DNA (cytosine-5)-methyltransferase 1
LDLGLEAAGFRTMVAVESDARVAETIRLNRQWPIILEDIQSVPTEMILERAGLKPGRVDLLAGGPPCQPFSKSRQWVNGDTPRLNDPRAQTLREFLRVLRDVQPLAFLLENVTGFAFNGKDEGIRLLQRELGRINRDLGTRYEANVAELNAADYGVPQIRKRLFIVGSRDGLPFVFPEPTHADPGRMRRTLFDLPKQPWLTAWDAIGDLNRLTHPTLQVKGKWGDLLPSIPEGNNYLYHTPRGEGMAIFGWRRKYWSFLLKLAKASPSWTIQAQPGTATGPFHWKNRRLSVRELCRLQTFPDDFEVAGSITDAQRQLGNAVPCLIGEVLGRAIREQLITFGRMRKPLRFLPRSRQRIAKPEPVSAVPRKYHSLVGDHAPHPGTGKGPLVMTR